MNKSGQFRAIEDAPPGVRHMSFVPVRRDSDDAFRCSICNRDAQRGVRVADVDKDGYHLICRGCVDSMYNFAAGAK